MWLRNRFCHVFLFSKSYFSPQLLSTRTAVSSASGACLKGSHSHFGVYYIYYYTGNCWLVFVASCLILNLKHSGTELTRSDKER